MKRRTALLLITGTLLLGVMLLLGIRNNWQQEENVAGRFREVTEEESLVAERIIRQLKTEYPEERISLLKPEIVFLLERGISEEEIVLLDDNLSALAVKIAEQDLDDDMIEIWKNNYLLEQATPPEVLAEENEYLTYEEAGVPKITH